MVEALVNRTLLRIGADLQRMTGYDFRFASVPFMSRDPDLRNEADPVWSGHLTRGTRHSHRVVFMAVTEGGHSEVVQYRISLT